MEIAFLERRLQEESTELKFTSFGSVVAEKSRTEKSRENLIAK